MCYFNWTFWMWCLWLSANYFTKHHYYQAGCQTPHYKTIRNSFFFELHKRIKNWIVKSFKWEYNLVVYWIAHIWFFLFERGSHHADYHNNISCNNLIQWELNRISLLCRANSKLFFFNLNLNCLFFHSNFVCNRVSTKNKI